MNMSRKRPLNIGLEKMLSKANVISVTGEQLRHIPLDLIRRGLYQPRQEFDQTALEELAESIRAHGILQPIVLRQIQAQEYEIIAGERRWRAAQLAGLNAIPALVKEITDEAALAVALIENIQRQDLNALEEARALHRLLEEFQMTHEAVAKSVGKSRTAVTNLLRLLQLEDQVKTSLARGDIEMGHARALLVLPLNQQRVLAKEIVEKKLSVRETEQQVKRLSEGKSRKHSSSKASKPSADLAKLQQELSDTLGTRVNFIHRQSGAGKLVIEYPNLDILDGILKRIQ